MANLFPLYTKVAGVSKRNEDGTSRQELIESFVSEGTQLELQDESSPDHPEAIAVTEPYGGEIIGYLPAKDAERIREAYPGYGFEFLTVTVRSMGRPAPDAPIGVSLVIDDTDFQPRSDPPVHVDPKDVHINYRRNEDGSLIIPPAAPRTQPPAPPRQQARPAPQPPKPKKRRHILRWILIIIAVLVVLAYIGSHGRTPAP